MGDCVIQARFRNQSKGIIPINPMLQTDSCRKGSRSVSGGIEDVLRLLKSCVIVRASASGLDACGQSKIHKGESGEVQVTTQKRSSMEPGNISADALQRMERASIPIGLLIFSFTFEINQVIRIGQKGQSSRVCKWFSERHVDEYDIFPRVPGTSW
jgi:hypothetical protein